jgi:anaerobic selenocysteine-containing dehydrogenase
MSMLDRPISAFEGPADSVRVPVVPPLGECKPFQEVLVELASRLKLPAFTTAAGERKFKDYPDFVVNYEAQPGIGFLMGWRGADGGEHLRGAPNPKQWEMYAKNDCVFSQPLPETMHYMRNWNRAYLDFAEGQGLAAEERRRPARPLQRHAAGVPPRGEGADRRPPAARAPARADRRRTSTRCRSGTAARGRRRRPRGVPLHAITQRPMAMYHSWDSQNAWLRQIHSHNYLHVNPRTAQQAGIADGGWCWAESAWGRVRCLLRYSEAVEPGTVWTWNAIGKADGAWQLAPGADEARKGFLLNHLIADTLPFGDSTISNSDPVTGQAGWYDVRVRLVPAEPEPLEASSPQVAATPAPPGVRGVSAVSGVRQRGDSGRGPGSAAGRRR